MTRIFPLHVHLQEGFTDNTVILRINGKEVYKGEHVSTNLLTGPAESFTILCEEGPMEVEVIIPDKNIDESTKSVLTSETYIGVSIVDLEVFGRRIRFLFSDKIFGYL